MIELLKQMAIPLIFIVPMALIFLPDALKTWFKHRERMAELRNPKSPATNPANNQDFDELRQRCDALEKRATKLEEQLKDAHLLLSDEQRALDRKLASIIPDEATESRTRSTAPSKTVM
jgi:hypothetical protein